MNRNRVTRDLMTVFGDSEHLRTLQSTYGPFWPKTMPLPLENRSISHQISQNRCKSPLNHPVSNLHAHLPGPGPHPEAPAFATGQNNTFS